jgi:hypothetical protein
MLLNVLVLSLTLIAAADLSNERIPVSGLQLEKHWRVDCKDLVQQYNALVTNNQKKADLKHMEKLVQEAELCRFIYNVRESEEGSCPDYQTILVMLSLMITAGEGNRPAIDKTAVIECATPS